MSTARLRAQLTAAVEWGLRFVDRAELTAAVAEGAPLDGSAAIVFDDSLVGVHHAVLADLGLPATIFVVSDALGSAPAWWPGAARVMTPAEVVEMAGAGVVHSTAGGRHRAGVGQFGLRHARWPRGWPSTPERRCAACGCAWPTAAPTR